MSRSLRKGPFVDPKLLKKVMKQKASNSRDAIKTWARSCTIVPEFVGHNFAVHDGHKFVPIFVTEAMVGHKLGEFAPTRIFRAHSGRKTDEASSGG
ncbi:MAG: 30S ribosomal protein S19 [Planctomycetota bacterium]|nr:30S ribosomal protein S19 [Planctomycetota bacterium]